MKDDKQIIRDKPLRIACLGGGQLGRMLALEAPRLNLEMSFLDPAGAACPAAATVPSDRIVQGSLQDADKIQQLAVNADIVTVEIEHVNVDALAQVESQAQCQVQPSARVLSIIRDKYCQKLHFQAHGIPVPPFCETDSVDSIQKACQTLGVPLMLKSRTGAYDGRGNAVLQSDNLETIRQALDSLGVPSQQTDHLNLYAEGWIDFDVEVAVMVVRSSLEGDETVNATSTTTTKCYPAVNAIQQNSICRVVLAPARGISTQVCHAAEQLAVQAIDSLGRGASGVFGVEMFVVNGNQVLLNEVAPRPHNTGHYTQDACATSQFENHLRGICGLPLGSTDMIVEAAAMVNVLGSSTSMTDTLASSNAALQMPRAAVHWYGKTTCRKGRKMGHINLTANSVSELDFDLNRLLELEGIPMSLLPSSKSSSALVGVIMGSQSDLPTMNAAVEILKKFNVPYQVDIVSAHRTPDKLMAYSRNAVAAGIRVIIAGAGGAAHLPGMVASMTCLPVIGVPVKTSTLSGVDSLYSIVQMPRGIPVATVAIGNATNAGLLAVRILSVHRPELRDKMVQYQEEMKHIVDASSTKLLELGSDAFLAQMDDKNKSVNV